mmetsp:Transcript_20588/g.55504  ORF Transcript_20588/g.55504 Transcript_20588/m.55504 type:complete len:247 (-) Transcript_20588:565-1305(-)
MHSRKPNQPPGPESAFLIAMRERREKSHEVDPSPWKKANGDNASSIAACHAPPTAKPLLRSRLAPQDQSAAWLGELGAQCAEGLPCAHTTITAPHLSGSSTATTRLRARHATHGDTECARHLAKFLKLTAPPTPARRGTASEHCGHCPQARASPSSGASEAACVRNPTHTLSHLHKQPVHACGLRAQRACRTHPEILHPRGSVLSVQPSSHHQTNPAQKTPTHHLARTLLCPVPRLCERHISAFTS